MKTTLGKRTYIVASVISRRWYGVKLEKSGVRFPHLVQIGYAVVRALDAAKKKSRPAPPEVIDDATWVRCCGYSQSEIAAKEKP